MAKLQRGLNEQFKAFQSRLRVAHETLTNVIRATGTLQRSRFLDAVRDYAAAKAREAGFDDLANKMSRPKISQDIQKLLAPAEAGRNQPDLNDLER